MTTASDELLTVPEVMARLRKGRAYVYELIRTGRLSSIKLGNSRRIPPDAVRRFIADELERAA